MKFISESMAKIDDLSVRERGAIFIAVLAVIFFIWDSYFMAALDKRERTLKTQLQQEQSERGALNVELQVLISERQEDPNKRNREKLASLRAQLDEIGTEVTETTKHLISPNRMAVVLENVLSKTRGLELVKVKGLGSSPLVVDDKQTGGKAGGDQTAGDTAGNTEENGVITNAYKHGLQVEFNGSFMSTLEYIKELEALDDKFIWDNLRLDIGEYPEGRAAVTVFTLSLDRNWIGT